MGDELWSAVAEAGEEFGIKPIAPCEARRIEAGIFNYGSDMTIDDTPLHVMGLERLVEEQPQDYIGKEALERIKREGVDRKLVGIELEGDELRAEMSEYWPVHHGGREVGHMTDAVWSPGLAKNIGYVWVPLDLSTPGTALDVETEDGDHLVGADRRDPVRRPAQGEAGRLPGRVTSRSDPVPIDEGSSRVTAEPGRTLHDRERTPRVKPATRTRPFLSVIACAALLFAACTNAPVQGRGHAPPRRSHPFRPSTPGRSRTPRSRPGCSRPSST